MNYLYKQQKNLIRFLLILFAKNNFVESVNYFAIIRNCLVATEKRIIIIY